jgi:transposase
VGRKRLYTEEFRSEAVRLARTSDLSIRQVADDLGVPAGTLANWLRAAAPTTVSTEGPLTGDERAELVGLRRRVRVLETEREILRKAAAFFAQESERTR